MLVGLRRGAQSPCTVGIPVPDPLFATKSPSGRAYVVDQRGRGVHEPDFSAETSSVYCYDTRHDDWNKRLQQPRYEYEYVQGKWKRTFTTGFGMNNDPKPVIRMPVPYADPIAISSSTHNHMVYM